MSWLSGLFKKGFRISKTLCWKGEEKLHPVDNFSNPGTRDKPITEIVDTHKTDRKKEDR